MKINILFCLASIIYVALSGFFLIFGLVNLPQIWGMLLIFISFYPITTIIVAAELINNLRESKK